MSTTPAEVMAAFELERLMHKAAATRFERTPSGFVCANPELPAVWDASRVQIEPDGEPPSVERVLELAPLPESWYPVLRHREVYIAQSDEGRELAWSLAKAGWKLNEQALMVCRTPPRQVPQSAQRVEGPAMRRLKGRLGVEQGLPPSSIAQFDRYDDLRTRAAARLTYAGFEGRIPLAVADTYLRGDIAVIEDVATLRSGRRQGLATAAVLGATAAALRLSARAVYLFADPDLARTFYEPLGFERIGGAYECQLPPPD